jgi:hypothetical protein
MFTDYAANKVIVGLLDANVVTYTTLSTDASRGKTRSFVPLPYPVPEEATVELSSYEEGLVALTTVKTRGTYVNIFGYDTDKQLLVNRRNWIVRHDDASAVHVEVNAGFISVVRLEGGELMMFGLESERVITAHVLGAGEEGWELEEAVFVVVKRGREEGGNEVGKEEEVEEEGEKEVQVGRWVWKDEKAVWQGGDVSLV